MRKILLLGFSILLISFSAAYAAEEKETNGELYRQLNLFGDVFERVRSDYVEEKPDKELVEKAINGMLTALDPHSAYLDAKSYQDMQVQTRGEFGGLGIEVTMDNGLVKVVSPIDDTPAQLAGVQAGDYVTHLDGKPVMGLTLSEAVELMRGKPKSKIVLTIKREGKDLFDITIIRDVIRIKSVRDDTRDNIGYVRITTFNEKTERELKKSIEEIKEKLKGDIHGLVLDLRNNPGGLLDQAIAVSDAFLDKGEIVSTRGRKVESTRRYNARPGEILPNVPVVVLINGGSASASEIVAGALQDHHRAIVMGTKSFGKGSVQTIIPVPGNGAMRLTTARYYTPSGISIQAEGINPDIEVIQAKVEEIDPPSHASREADLRGALDVKNKTGKDNGSDDESRTMNAKDYQLTRAIDVLKGIHLSNRIAQPTAE